MLSASPVILFIYLVAFLLLYFVTKCIYRLTLHPLSRFPGPRTAAMTRLHAMSFDIPYRTSYVKEFTTYHDRYASPIVRIEPNHLHIRDIDAYNEIFRIGSKFTRDPAIYNFPATTGSMFNELEVKKGVAHRSLYNSFFSRASVEKLEPVIRLHLKQFFTKLDKAAETNRPADLTLGFRCLMADTLMRYCYGRPFGALEAEEFRDPMIMAIAEMLDSGPAMAWYGGRAFVELFKFVMKLPRRWIPDRGIAESLRLLDGCRERIDVLSRMPQDQMPSNVFKTALNPNIEKGQPRLSPADLGADGFVLFTAGADTTANAMTYATYNLIHQTSTLQRLRSELNETISSLTRLDSDSASDLADFPLSWSALSKLPYLSAVVKESIRVSYGVPGKIPRVVPPEGITLSGQFIPGGTTVSSSSYSYHSNDEYFSDAKTFKPERWLPDVDGKWSANGNVDPEKHFVAFSRGSRSCLGINLAYAELYYTIAYLVRSFELRLDEEMREGDMDWHDAFTLATFGHLKVRLSRILAQ